MTIRFEPLSERHIMDATALAFEGYRREVRHAPALADDGARDRLGDAIATLVRQGHGTAAIDDDRLTGYLAFFGPIEGFFGSGTGCFSPLHGLATAGEDRERLTSLLFQRAAAGMIANGVDTFAITTWHHDDDVSRSLILNGFGMRCTDAIRTIDPPLQTEPVPGITFRVLAWSEAGLLLPLLNGLVRHLRRSPTFVAANEFTSESFAALRERRKSRFFVAFRNEEPIGYLEVTEDGENVLTTAPDMRNICGAYLEPEHRGRGIYQNLLQTVLTTLRGEGVRRVGVDFETMNPTALRFWTKYFDRYTTSFVRRIDDLG
ncbi:MAG TPA: GNAT family N-acetyltransferase [Thermomicrobiales bacterium]|nr:GNAT family N-acetyltransferase [Thermomicrobiales bacterium]